MDYLGIRLGTVCAMAWIFGLKRKTVTEGDRKLHNEELHNLYSS
jgi:hypothetical protein